MLAQSLFLFLGFLFLLKGADWMVDGASALAKKNNISDLAIGLTIVAFGTSAPELVVNSFASYQDHQDIVFGNVIGSNNFNLFVILGITGLISPLVVQSSTVWKEIPLSFVAILMLYGFVNSFSPSQSPILSRFEGFLLLVMFILFLIYVYKQLKTNDFAPGISTVQLSALKIWMYIITGLAGLVIGGKLVVNSAVEIATVLGVSEKIVGLTIVAMGTSLPELATSVIAVVKKNNDIAIGNIIGSNIFNIFFVLSVSSLIRPIPYDVIFNTDLYIFAGGTLFLFIAMFTGRKKKLDRWEAGLLLLTYIMYTAYLIARELGQ